MPALLLLRDERGRRAVVVRMDPRLCLPRPADRGVPATRMAWVGVSTSRGKRQLGQKLSGKVQPKRSGADLARLTEGPGVSPWDGVVFHRRSL